MNTLFIIWLIGYIILFSIFITILFEEGDVTLGDLIRIMLFSIFSWAILVVMFIEYANSIIIYKKKK